MEFRQPIGIGRLLGVPIYLNWSGFLVPFIFAFFTHDLIKTISGTCAYFALILIHEIGHALFAMRRKLKVISIHLSALHGLCTYRNGWRRDEVFVSWGGVCAQLVLFVASVAVANAVVLITPAFSGGGKKLDDAVRMFGFIFGPCNAIMIFVNLYPVAPLDGATAWRIIPAVDRRHLRRR
jgi:stage IV sporulation protein FB